VVVKAAMIHFTHFYKISCLVGQFVLPKYKGQHIALKLMVDPDWETPSGSGLIKCVFDSMEWGGALQASADPSVDGGTGREAGLTPNVSTSFVVFK